MTDQAAPAGQAAPVGQAEQAGGRAAPRIGRSRQAMAERVARDLRTGWYVNLGIGMPQAVAGFIPPGVVVTFHSENGLLGVGPTPAPDRADPDLIDAGKQPVTLLPGGSAFDSALSFALIRGGHLDLTVLGGLQVSAGADLANWNVPGVSVGVGGAMDLVQGARQVWVMMDHQDRRGRSKLVPACDLELTGSAVVDRVYTNLGVFHFINGALTLVECAEGVTADYIAASTEARFEVDLAPST